MSESPISEEDRNVFTYNTRLGQDQIRLLRVLPGAGEDTIKCHLSVATLEEAKGGYDALSYCWGSSDLATQIQCNDATLSITTNLHDALWQSRENGENRPLWADAICINQNDLEEKTAQVQRMMSIYQSSHQVIIWLGKQRECDASGLRLLQKLGHAPKVIDFGGESGVELDLSAAGLPDLFQDDWMSLLALFARPWFYRVWTIQESIVNPNTLFRCGDTDIPFKTVITSAKCLLFANVLSWMQVKMGFGLLEVWDPSAKLTRPPNVIQLLAMADPQTGPRPNLLDLLMFGRSYEATDPRDKLFALVGLADDFPAEFVDYGLSLRDVLFNFAYGVVDATKRKDGYWPYSPTQLIAWASMFRDQSSPLNLPTWVPNVASSDSIGMPCHYRYAPGYDCVLKSNVLGCGEWRVSSNQSTNSEVKPKLISKGHYFDAVHRIISDSSLPENSFEGTRRAVTGSIKAFRAEHFYFQNAIDLVLEANPRFSDNEAEEAIWRALLYNVSEPGEALVEQDWEAFQAARRVCKRASECPDDTNIEDVLQDDGLLRSRFASSWAISRAGHLLFISGEGRVGMVSGDAKPDDQIHYFLGSQFPLVLRPDSGSFKVVGGCYLHGAMDGEAHSDLDNFKEIVLI